ncbi:MAG: hypothetical protein E3J21_04285 [Anaerolineales bacterium]|nr:MAG: hypothetical protein E3J21_04285 [Anaerolineales bacterium]
MKDPHEIIDHLSPTDALSILRTLASSDEQLAARIAEIATAHLSEVDPEEVAAVLYDELDALEVEEVWDRAGPKRDGYVDPSEAAYGMVEEVIDPYLEELKKYQKLGMNAEANRMCMGLLLGLYRFKHESTSEFKNWAPDAPSGFAWAVVNAWKAGSPSRADVKAVKAFIEDYLCGWGAHLV